MLRQRSFFLLTALALCCSDTTCSASVPAKKMKEMRDLVLEGKFNQARDLMSKYRDIGLADAEFRVLQADMLRLSGRTDEAIKEYRRALDICSDNLEALIALSELHLQNLQLEQSLQYARQALHFHPDRIAAAIAYATALLSSDHTAEAERHVNMLKERHSRNPEVQLLIYRLEKKKGDFAAARKALQFVIMNAEKQDPHWQVELADLLESEGDYQAARRELESLLQSDPDFSEARYRLARLLEFRFRDFVAAQAAYNAMLKLNPQSDEAAGGIRRCRRKQRDIAYRLKSTWQEALHLVAPGKRTNN